jgi:hypothetical protein
MLSATELRIGNLVNYDTAEGDVFTNVIDWQDLKWLSEDEQGFNLVHNPIPLTEEWLLKFGFEYRKEILFDGWYSKLINYNSIRIFKDENGFFKYYSSITNIHYVHQLQNLFYCLCGKELTLKK